MLKCKRHTFNSSERIGTRGPWNLSTQPICLFHPGKGDIQDLNSIIGGPITYSNSDLRIPVSILDQNDKGIHSTQP